MLKINPEAKHYVDPAAFYDKGSEFSFRPSSWATIRRQWPLIALVTGCVVVLSILYLFTASPKFTASAMMLIDTHKNQVFEKQQVVADAPLDASTVESQVEVVKSESVLLSVIRKLKLTEDPEFNGSDRGVVRTVIGKLESPYSEAGPASETQIERRAVDTLSRNLVVKRVGLTYAIEIDYTSKGAAKSAQIANAIADAYMVAELNAKYQATRRAGLWMQDRIKELRTEATVADEAVRNFKAVNNLVDTSRGLMSQEQLTDVNTQLIQAQAATAEAKAKLDRVNEVSRSDVTDASITDALKSDVISRLRAQYLDLAAKEGDWSARYGANHLAVTNLRSQMHEIRRSIGAELKRIAEAYTSDYMIALAREVSVQNSLKKLVGESAGTGKAQVRLRDLESTAQTYRNLYDNFLERSTEAAQQQTFLTGEARIITEATTPLTKSSPKTLLILAGSALLGAFLGLCAAFGRERMDNVFRTGAQIEQVTGLECLGTLPMISVPKQEKSPVGTERLLPVKLGISRYVTEAPFSRFAETLRSVKVAANISGLTSETRILGVVSAVPREGKTTVAANFAFLLAQSGKTLLIDSDLRHPSMTRELIGEANRGLITAIQDPDNMSNVVWRDPVTSLDFMPAETGLPVSHTSEVISSPAMAKLLVRMRESYDYIVLDLPPIAPVVDVKAVSHLVDKFVMVVEWGKTTKESVLEALNKVETTRELMLGVVLNKANPTILKRLEYYHGRNYSSYYDNESPSPLSH
jgi:succinoglycan biosynthesis transport protein ExoP